MGSKKMKFALGITMFAVAALVLMVGVPVAHSAGDDSGPTFTFSGTGTQSLQNPCNFRNVSGNVNIRASVSVFGEDPDGKHVFVTVSYNATGQSDGINNYNEHGRSTATFDTLAPGGYYDLPLTLDYDSTNNPSVSFKAGTDAFVLVDANQHPFSVPDVGRTSSCDGK